MRWPAMMGWLIACAGVVTGLRVLAHIRHSVVIAALAPIAFATLLAIVAGFAWQRQPSRFGGGPRALAAALTCVGFVLGLGYWRHHVPWEPAGAVGCSLARAETILASVNPDPVDDRAALEAAVARTPHACTDWGLATFEVYDGCLGFADADSGEWWTCRGDDGFVRFVGWDRRW